MENQEGAGQKKFGITIDRTIQIAVPTIFAVGAAYWFGVIRVVGLDYLSLLGAQDLLAISILILPAYGMLWLASVGSGWNRPESSPDTERQYLYGRAIRKADGTWIQKGGKLGARIVATVLASIAAGFAFCVIEPRNSIAVVIEFFAIPIGALILGEYAAYRRDRFGDGHRVLAVMSAVFLGMLSYLIGAMQAHRAEDEVSDRQFQITLSNESSPLIATGLHKLSDYFLLYDRQSQRWKAIRAERVQAIDPIPKPEQSKASAPTH